MVTQGGTFSIQKQCKLLNVPRSSFYYKDASPSQIELNLMRLIDEIYLKYRSMDADKYAIIYNSLGI